MKNILALAGLGIGVWSSAFVGIALKLALPGRFDRLSVVLCLLIGEEEKMSRISKPRSS
jgi:hemolysin III